MATNFFGWIDNPAEVARQMPAFRIPEFKAVQPPTVPNKEVLLYKMVRQVTGKDAPSGPQEIGDCVSWGWGNLVNYVACLQIYLTLQAANLTSAPPNDPAVTAITAEYQECATEATYGFSRVEIGTMDGSYSDGSIGAWAARSVVELGTLSRPYLESKGLGGAYNPQRAKEWGAKGVPDTLEPQARQHTIQTTSRVTSFNEAVAAVQNGYPVAVCSNRGFTTNRDSQGFCKPSGTWNHCMLFMAVRWDRPGLCLAQSWGPVNPTGPRDKDQPSNSFWVEPDVCDYMLRQGDSFTGSQFADYPNQDLIDWSH